MAQIFIILPCGGTYCLETCGGDISDSINVIFPHEQDFYITRNGKRIPGDEVPVPGQTYHVVPRLVGGKGGFGSMLRAIGAQIDKTKSREAMRDLSGRRMRDVNNEKKLREWVAKKADREKEKEEKKREKLERQLQGQRHRFDDQQYMEQKAKVADDLEDALQQGLQKASSSGEGATAGPSRKRKSESRSGPSMKRAAEWLGLDVDNLSDLDSDLTSSEDDAQSSSRMADFGGSITDASMYSDSKNPQQTDRLKDFEEASKDISQGASSCGDKNEVTSDSLDIIPNEEKTEEVSSDEQPEATTETSDIPSKEENQGETETSKEESTSMESSAQEAVPDVPKSDGAETKEQEESKPPTATDVDLDVYNSAEELENLGLDTLKLSLQTRGLKCGGTLQERAARLFAVKGLAPEQIDPSFFAKASKGKGKGKGKHS